MHGYPVVIWIFNGNLVQLNGFELVPEEPDFWSGRAILLVALCLALSGGLWKLWAAAQPQSIVRRLSRWLPWITVVLSFGAAAALPQAYSLVGVIAVVFALFGSGAIAVTVALAFALVLATVEGAIAPELWSSVIVIALVGAATVIYLEWIGRFAIARLLLCCIIIGTWVAGALWFDWVLVTDGCYNAFVFLAVLPLLNATIDAVSYAVTLAFVRRGLSVGMPILLGALDVVLALALFLALGALLVTVIAGLNRLAGAPLLDLGLLFAGIWDSWQPVGPDGLRPHLWDYAWVYAMLFSAAVPTILHLMVSLIGSQGITPRPLRLRLGEWLDTGPLGSGEMIVQAGLLSLVWFAPFVLAGGLLWALWWLGMVSGFLGVLGQGYFNALLWLASLQGAF